MTKKQIDTFTNSIFTSKASTILIMIITAFLGNLAMVYIHTSLWIPCVILGMIAIVFNEKDSE